MLVLLQSGVGRFRWFLLLLRHNSMRSACVSVRLCVCVCVCIEQQLNAKFLTSARAATNKKCGDRKEQGRSGVCGGTLLLRVSFAAVVKKWKKKKKKKRKKKRASSCTQRQPPPSFLSFLSFLFFLSLSFLSFLSFFGRSGVLFWRLNALSICCVSCVYEERRKKHTHTLRET